MMLEEESIRLCSIYPLEPLQRAAGLGALLTGPPALSLRARSHLCKEPDRAEPQAVGEIDNPWSRAYPLVLFGQITLQQDGHAQARDLFEEGSGSFKEAGDQSGMADALIGVAGAATMLGDFVAARDLYMESFQIIQRIQYKELIPSCLEGLAAVAAELGELVRAAHLWGAAETLREAIGPPIPPVYRPGYERAVTKARAQAGNEVFARAWAEGRTMTPEQALINSAS